MKAAFSLMAAAAIMLLGASSPVSAAGGIELAGHQAAYTMSLSSARLSGGVTSASGSMTYEFRDACDGWTVKNVTDLSFSYGADPPVTTSWQFATWEAKNGPSYRFWVRSTRDGEVDQMIDGNATLSATGQGGIAHFTQPSRKSIKLPKGTLFPTAHTILLIQSAMQGQNLVRRTLFDGTDPTGPTDASAFIGRERDPSAPVSKVPAADISGGDKSGADKSAIAGSLLAMPSWPMQLAFYPIKGGEVEPDYEIGLRYYLNGIADRVVQSFGDFTVAGRLQSLHPLPKPAC